MWGHKMKRFEISYNPYNNRMHFRVAVPVDEESIPDWRELLPESIFSEYQNNECIFENSVENILYLINKYINTTEILELVFKGTAEDFDILQNAVYACADKGAKRITCTHSEVYLSPKTALERIKRSYSKVENEFDFYFNTFETDTNNINEDLICYKDAVKQDIPICVIGSQGVGKSVLINALIGQDILPSFVAGSSILSAIVRNEKEYRLEFVFLHELYVIVFEGKNYSVKIPTSPDENFISALFFGCETCSSEQEVMHHVLERLYSEDFANVYVGSIGKSVSVYIPFGETQLDLNDYSYTFIETPVQIEESDEDVSIVLEDVAIKQTNALPIVVVTRNTLVSEELLDLKKLFDELGDGFAKSNSIIAVSMSDALTPSQMKDEIPDSVREGIANPTIMYVSPVVALHENDARARALVKLNPPGLNISPSQRTISTKPKDKSGKILLASGMPSLEYELNYYAKRFSDYRKCAKGQQFLLDAINKLIVEMKVSKTQYEKELKVDNSKRQKEQSVICSEMIMSINQVQKPDLNSVFEKVSTQFRPVLDDYCKGVQEAVRSCWVRVGHRTNDADNLFKEMQNHCQTNLYDKNGPIILNAIKEELLSLTSDDMSKIKIYITDHNDVLSSDIKRELNAIFDAEPQLVDIDIQPFVLITTNFVNMFGSDETIIAKYSKGFIEQLKPTSIRWGHFDRQCIQEPTLAYSKQLSQWIEMQLKEIRVILGVDNSILSKLDNRIDELNHNIDDLRNRIDNLSNVQTALLELIPFEDRS